MTAEQRDMHQRIAKRTALREWLLGLEERAAAAALADSATPAASHDSQEQPVAQQQVSQQHSRLDWLQACADRQVRQLGSGLPLPADRGFSAALQARAGAGDREQLHRFLAGAMEKGAAGDTWIGELLRDHLRHVSLTPIEGSSHTSADDHQSRPDHQDHDAQPLIPAKLRVSMGEATADEMWSSLRIGLRRSAKRARRRRWLNRAAAAVVLGSLLLGTAVFQPGFLESLGISGFRGTRDEPRFVYREVFEPPAGSLLATAPLRVITDRAYPFEASPLQSDRSGRAK